MFPAIGDRACQRATSRPKLAAPNERADPGRVPSMQRGILLKWAPEMSHSPPRTLLLALPHNLIVGRGEAVACAAAPLTANQRTKNLDLRVFGSSRFSFLGGGSPPNEFDSRVRERLALPAGGRGVHQRAERHAGVPQQPQGSGDPSLAEHRLFADTGGA